MSYTKGSPMRMAFIGAVVALLLIWTLWSLEFNSVLRATDENASLSKPNSTPQEFIPIVDPEADSPIVNTVPGVETSPAHIPDPADQLGTSDPSRIYHKPNVSDRPVILYAYSDGKTKKELHNARANFEFFLAHGLHTAADFVFIFNGKSDAVKLVPKGDHIRIVERPNDCYDIGAYAEVLLANDFYKRYTKFIMLNASIRGPFLPYWASGCWTDMYLGRITDEVKLVGMTGNCWPTFHIQSMIWATDIIGLTTLLFPPAEAIAKLSTEPLLLASADVKRPIPAPFPGINSCFHTWGSAVAAEVGSSAIIKAAGYKLDVMMSAYHSSPTYEEDCDSSENGDVLFDKKYFGTNVHPFETVFIKTNRDIDPIGLIRLTEWTKGRKYSSYDFCPV